MKVRANICPSDPCMGEGRLARVLGCGYVLELDAGAFIIELPQCLALVCGCGSVPGMVSPSLCIFLDLPRHKGRTYLSVKS